MSKKVVLIITDGIGHSEKLDYNAFHHAKKPHYDYLFKHVPNSLVRTFGISVGLPDNQMGNSEVGHMSLGSGRVLFQDLVKINNAIEDKSLDSNPALLQILGVGERDSLATTRNLDFKIKDSSPLAQNDEDSLALRPQNEKTRNDVEKDINNNLNKNIQNDSIRNDIERKAYNDKTSQNEMGNDVENKHDTKIHDKSQNDINNQNLPLSTLHLAILASSGGVHSHINHLIALIKIAKAHNKKVWLHLISDGRDVKPQSFLEHIEPLLSLLDENVKIATISGRFYAMDRDNRWDRIERAFNVMCYGENPQTISIHEYIKNSYEKGIYDEFIEPASFEGYEGFSARVTPLGLNHINAENLDSQTQGFIFVNYRSDRAREIVSSVGLRDFAGFERRFFPNLLVGCMCEYDERFPFLVFFPKDNVRNTLAEVISRHGLKQAHIAETEKYAHVTFFFNGGREEEFSGEERLLIESPKVKTYDLKPEMSAREVADGVCDFIRRDFDFIVVNFANGDMVGHTGNFEASIKAVEALDSEIAKIWNLAKDRGYSIVMTSDHGNCEEMKDENLKPLTNHTVGDVFCFVDSKGVDSINNGALNNIAPSILKIMGLPIPEEMDGALF